MSKEDYYLDCSDEFKIAVHKEAIKFRNLKREQLRDKKVSKEDMWLYEAMEREFRND